MSTRQELLTAATTILLIRPQLTYAKAIKEGQRFLADLDAVAPPEPKIMLIPAPKSKAPKK